MKRYAICYVSSANSNFQREEIKKLFTRWEKVNQENDVKGILLFAEGNFFQVLEGKKKFIIQLFTKIQKDPRHNNIIQIIEEEMKKGGFDSYKCDLVTEANKYDRSVFKDYLETMKGMDAHTQEVASGMLEVFIETSK